MITLRSLFLLTALAITLTAAAVEIIPRELRGAVKSRVAIGPSG